METDLTFDLTVWPVDRALTREEALVMVESLGGSSRLGFGHDKRLDAFIEAVEARYPGARSGGPEMLFEFAVLRDHVSLGLPWNVVEEVVTAIGQIAFRTGVAVYDPQRELVALPAPFAEEPMTAHGVQPHVDTAESAFGAIARGVAFSAGDDPADVVRRVDEEAGASGFRVVSPLGIEVTPDIEAEVAADPLRMPTSLQTPDRKAELIVQLAAPTVGDRHRALIQLAAWDADPEVSAALRPLLASDDVFEASQAANGLARQGDISDLPALVALVHRMSPADGATLESMVMVLPAALTLAKLAGPVAIDGLTVRAREWRGAPPRGLQPWQVDFYREIDRLLDEP